MSSDDGHEKDKNAAGADQPTKIQQAISAISADFERFVQAYKAYRKEHDANEREKYIWEKRTARGVWLYTLLTLGIVVISICQLRQSERNATQQHNDTNAALQKADMANDIAKRQIRQDQRAWIEIKPKVNEIKVVPGQPVAFDIVKVNIGKTVARHTVAVIELEKLSPLQSPSFSNFAGKVADTSTAGTVFPNEEPQPFKARWLAFNPTTNHVDPVIASKADAQDWKDGKFYFAIYGRIDYLDIFGFAHWTTFCAAAAGKAIDTPTRECRETFNDVDDNE